MAAFQTAAQIDCVFQTIRTDGEPLRTALYRCVPAYFTPMSLYGCIWLFYGSAVIAASAPYSHVYEGLYCSTVE